MRQFFKYIFVVTLSSLLAVSCIEEMDMPQPVVESDVLTLVPRVTNFANRYVTKAEGSDPDAEKTITSLAVLVFDSEGKLVHIEETSGASTLSLNKSMLNIESATLVMFANSDIASLKSATSLTLENLETYALRNISPVVTEANMSASDFKGLPMMGRLEGVDLTATATSQKPLAVSLKILYAKVNFTIGVAQGSENQGTGSFTMNSLSVYNAALTTDIAAETYADVNSTYTAAETGTVVESKEDGTYTFYVSENRYNPGESLSGIYPSDDWLTTVPAEDVKGYAGEADNDKLNGVKYFYDDLIQQYKPILATKGAGQATYALLSGVYTDYRGTVWNVEYKIYLGKDNSQNFEVDRNSEYSNTITIKGIRNNGAYGEDDVWVDHRVNVSLGTQPLGTGSADDCVTITRETLIDSHIEVRPLRVKWDGDTYAGVRVYLPTESNGTLVSWIGMERFTGENCLDGSTYCYVNGQAIGKRKYFTTTLISDLQEMGGEFGVQTDNNKKHLYLLNGECVWIYFDEHIGSTEREAIIKLEFYSKDGNTITTEEYVVKQRGLRIVEGYAIESYEEYLHTYDSADKYNLSTSPADYTQQGLAWGLNDKTISKDVIVSATALNIGNLGVQGLVGQRYDYFHESDDPEKTYHLYTNADGSWDEIDYETGLEFTNRASANESITIKDMGTIPSSAYQYCLSKNKFNEDDNGNHTIDIHWYLPDVYELQEVLAAGTNAIDIASNSYYWSSQPSYSGATVNIGTTISIKNEVSANARAASATSTNGADIARTSQNRIRCFYSAEGIKNVDMSDRAPDGMGGNFTFHMHAYIEKQKSSPAYFQYLLPAAETKPTTTTRELNDEFGYSSTTDSYPYPTSANSSASTEFAYKQYQKDDGSWIGGFEVNPGLKDNWDETVADYYSTLNTYPGLSKFVTQKGVSTARRETSTEKKDVQTETDVSTIVYNKSLSSNTALNYLDHVNGGTKLSISFGTITGGNNSTFIYDENVSESKTVKTRYWEPPVYTNQSCNLLPNESTATGTDSGSEINTNVTTNKDEARKDAFNRAYKEAKDNALKKLNDYVANLNSTDPGWEISGIVEYTPLAWNTIPTSSYSNEFSVYVLFVGNCWSSTCSVSVTATAKIIKRGSVSLYNISREGYWRSSTETTESSGVINTDELRFYCGNSLTISVNDSNYEISKVKVYFRNGNQIRTTTLPVSSTHARFVDSTLLPTDGSNIIKTESKSLNFESVDVIQLNGMDYSANSSSGEVWQQWSGNGRSSVTLVLADYHIQNGDWTNWTESIYTYKIADTDLSKYFIIDRIEVKCTKKSSATTE